MTPLQRLIILILCPYTLFLSWLVVTYPEPIIDSSPVRHVEKVIIKPIIYDKKAIFTAYTLSASETDSTPEVGAGNHFLPGFIARGIRPCATRRFQLHTIIEVEGYGRYEVLDRTSKKYSDRIDLLYQTKEEAINFGKKTISYKIIKQ